MSSLIQIRSQLSSNYTVQIGRDLFQEELLKANCLIIDSFFNGKITPHKPTFFIEALETNKTFETAEKICSFLAQHQAHEVTAVGGGIIQDLVSFSCSIFQRKGLPWTYMPTTLLAAVDACVGGKNSLNVGPFKNLVGTFYPASRIMINTGVFQTLPAQDFTGGLIEAAKTCYAHSQEAFIRFLEAQTLEEIIEASLKSKIFFVEEDERGHSSRQLLNLGHTYGHAVESAVDFQIPHGMAVGFGILCAIQLREDLHGSAQGLIQRLQQDLKTKLTSYPDLIDTFQKIDLKAFWDAFLQDKKHSPSHWSLILPKVQGGAEIEKLPQTDRSKELILTTLQKVFTNSIIF